MEVIQCLVLAVCCDLLDMESEVFEEFMDAEVALEDEDAPSIGSWVFLAEEAEGLEVRVAYVVHPSINLADVDPENGQFVAV